TVKLIELPIEEKHVPNIFLNAALVSDRQIFVDTKQIVVPPVKNFLTVDVKSDRVQYQPRDEGTILISTKTDEGKPVSAEVSLGLVDESVYYIQSDYAGDPRQFYFGSKRSQQVQTQSTFQHKSYTKLVPGENEQLLDEWEKERRSGEIADEKDFANGNALADSDGAVYTRPRGEVAMQKESFALGGAVRTKMVTTTSASAASAMDLARSPAPMAAPPLGQAGGEEPAVVVRSDFRSTVIWQPD